MSQPKNEIDVDAGTLVVVIVAVLLLPLIIAGFASQ